MTPGGTAAFHTLGCKLNFSETSTIARDLAASGYARVRIDETPDVVVINTCSVTDHADSKCRNAVRRALNSNPNAFIAVIGCYAQLKPKEISEIPGVNLVLGAQEKFNLSNHLRMMETTDAPAIDVNPIKELKSFVPGFSSNDRTRAFLKVQDGCDYFCSFCTIPLARGRSRNASIDETLHTAGKAAQSGAKEIVLTGVNIGDFGKSTDENFYELVQALDTKIKVPRMRISSIEPNLLEPSIIDLVGASERFQPHFHIPLQSGSDRILKAMRRRYRTNLYAERIHHIKDRMPHASIGVDVITGFPGEDDEAFQETYEFLQSLPISYLHVFTYSERDKTTAVRMEDVVPVAKRKERTKILRTLSLKKQRAHYEQFLNVQREVLFEDSTEDGLRFGYTPEYVRVGVDANEVESNEIVRINLTAIRASGFMTGSRISPIS